MVLDQKKPQSEIRVNQVDKAYGTKQVLKSLSMTIRKPSITGIMGGSGIGKTTLLRLLLNLEQPDSGSITGLERERISALFQEDRLCEDFNAIANVKMVCPAQVQIEEIIEAFIEIGISKEELIKPVRTFSGGMKRRVAVLRCLFADSTVLIMDEPLTGLDEKSKEQVIHFMKKRMQSKTVIFVTHIREEITMLGGELVLL